jgi:hypothetical protein
MVDRLLRTITAACTQAPFADRTAQACAYTLVSIGMVAPQFHVAGLEAIGFLVG